MAAKSAMGVIATWIIYQYHAIAAMGYLLVHQSGGKSTLPILIYKT